MSTLLLFLSVVLAQPPPVVAYNYDGFELFATLQVDQDIIVIDGYANQVIYPVVYAIINTPRTPEVVYIGDNSYSIDRYYTTPLTQENICWKHNYNNVYSNRLFLANNQTSRPSKSGPSRLDIGEFYVWTY